MLLVRIWGTLNQLQSTGRLQSEITMLTGTVVSSQEQNRWDPLQAQGTHAWEEANLNECVKLDPHALSPWVCQPNYSKLCKWAVLSLENLALFWKAKQIYICTG